VEFALTWSHLKFATEMALANIVSNQQASPITLAKRIATSPKATRHSNGFMRIGILPPPGSPTLINHRHIRKGLVAQARSSLAAQKGAGSKAPDSRNWVVSLVVCTLIAALMIVGIFLLLVSQKL
jgi:hypothetical protein